ncbi:BlaI/MecI/CopY family transcriptional regulator [Thalassotalea crassostreae]|uniref:BlaI/MecI/CopY family transcriptional regulator n=1 Tax=Thalassotalea crassostreae TaxID=1763536 RepID=UPI0008390D32|nr:BlaI/MecI/CopY family transcriptional regulator [Thalassotalea crassostreae]
MPSKKPHKESDNELNNTQLRKPTEAELSLLTTIWKLGPSTVRQIHTLLNEKQNIGYTTVLKILQIMFEKGLVQRDESQRAHVYSALHSPDITQQHLVGDLIEKVFAGNSKDLILQAIKSITCKAELADIEQAIVQAKG